MAATEDEVIRVGVAVVARLVTIRAPHDLVRVEHTANGAALPAQTLIPDTHTGISLEMHSAIVVISTRIGKGEAVVPKTIDQEYKFKRADIFARRWDQRSNYRRPRRVPDNPLLVRRH